LWPSDGKPAGSYRMSPIPIKPEHGRSDKGAAQSQYPRGHVNREMPKSHRGSVGKM